MRKLFALHLLICIALTVTAQKTKENNIPAFGKIEKADLQLKECDFDKKAEAMVLFEKGELTCIIGGSSVDMEFEKHVRIKILTDNGREHADIRLRYHSWGGDEDVREISAQTYNLDPNGNIVVTKIDRKSIFDKKINKRYSEKVFTFPEVKAGSIIEFKYVLTGAGLVNWYFQRSIPVKLSYFKIDFPQEIEIHSTPNCSRQYTKKNESTSTRTVQQFSMLDVPALRDEPFILNEDDYRDRIETRPIAFNIEGRRIPLTVTWPRVIKLLMEDDDFGIQLRKEIPRTIDLDAALSKISDPYHKMKTIHNYVRKNMQWNGYTSIWALEGVKAAWKDKKGTAGEINLILVNLLRDAGLKAKPILVSTHSNGLINTGNADYNQFNKVLAFVEIDSKEYILDATDKETPVDLIPFEVLLTEGLSIDKIETFEWGWKTLWNNNLLSKNLILMQGSIDNDGKMKGEVSINSYDYARIDKTPIARKGTKDFTEKYLTSSNPGITIDSVVIENIDVDSLPLVQTIHFNQQLSASGDYRYFSANLFTGLENNPFISDTRFSDVFFGVNQYYTIIGNFDIPDDYVFEELPKNMKMIMPDTSISISRAAQVLDGRLSLRMILEFKKPFYAVQEYPEFKEFYKKLQDILGEQFVIRKKAKP